MIASKHITKTVSALMALAVCLCLCAMAFSGSLAEAAGGTGVSMEYEQELFGTEKPITVNILMDEGQWEEMLQNAIEEEYYSCDVEVNGKMFYRVGVRPKGNTSLTSIASDPDTDRFSLKLEFDQYVDGQTCFGLDKLVLNSNYADASNRKEALVYDMFQYLEADASLYNFAEISVNGEYWGVYLALEAVEDSFLFRNYGADSGELYKPESNGFGGPGGMKRQQAQEQEEVADETAEAATGATVHENGGQQMRGGGMSGGNGADLNYTDDDPDSYSTIWEGEVTNTSASDRSRVVKALKNISEGSALETYMDVNNLLRYMAAHVFAVNQDSLSGNMAHNYYLYEHDGRLNMIPWDYNLAWGGMGMGADNASSVINDAVDTPFAATEFFDGLLENEGYLQKYHEYLSRLVEGYVFGGKLDEFYQRVDEQLSPLVESDPTAFYTYEEYLEAAEMLRQTIQLRGESIRGQLDGSIPSTDDGQREDPSALVDASGIDLSVMGGMNAGGGQAFSPALPADAGDGQPMENGQLPQGGDVPGEPPEGFDLAQGGGQFDPAEETEGTEDGDANLPEADGQENGKSLIRGGFQDMGRPGMGFGDAQSTAGTGGPSALRDNLILYSICFAVMTAALLFAKLYRRRSRRR